MGQQDEMKNQPAHSIWVGGRREYLKALQAEEKKQIDALREKLKLEADPEAKRKLKNQIKVIKAEFKKKEKASGSSLF